MLCIYRMLSKKRIARYKENIRFMRLINPILKRIYINERKMKDKQHKYCQCPSCKQLIWVDKGKEINKVSCPMCKSEFTR